MTNDLRTAGSQELSTPAVGTGARYALSDFQVTSPLPDFRGVPRGVESVSFLARHRIASLITAGLTTIAMIIGGLLIFL